MHRTAPGALIGYRSDGTPIRLQAGGSEPAPEPPPPAEPAPVPAPPAEPAPVPAPPPQAGQEPPAPRTIEDLPDFAQRIVREARTEAAKYRTQLRDVEQSVETKLTEQRDALARALGLAPEEVTPEQIAAERDAAKARADAESARARTSAVELATFRAAALMQADLGKLMDSRSFVATLDGLDPSAEGFADLVRDKVAAALEGNPGWKLAAPPPAPAPGAPPAAPPPLQPPSVPASSPQAAGFSSPPPPGGRPLTEADALQMTPQQVVDAINAGQFTSEGFGPRRSMTR